MVEHQEFKWRDGSGCEPSDESEESYSSGDDDFYTDHLTPMNTHSRATHSDHPDLLTADQKAAKTLNFDKKDSSWRITQQSAN